MNNVFKHIRHILAAVLLMFMVPAMAQDSINEMPEAAGPALAEPMAEEKADAEESGKFDAKSFIFGHTGDSYCFHITEIKGKPVCVWLPVIVKSKEQGWCAFSSKHVCELKDGETYRNFFIEPMTSDFKPGKLVEINSAGDVVRPFDLSFTKNAFGIFLVCAFLLAFFLPAAFKYKKDPMAVPTRYQGMVEWLTYMVLDGIVKPSISGEKYKRFAPYLLTVFFFIFFSNIFGLIPFFPFSANVTGNLSITVVLALMTYLCVNVFGNKHYWKDILWPDVPMFLKAFPLMPIIELISTITKPFALTVRLFANILAGHIIIMVLMGLIFILGGMYGIGVGAGVSVISIFMSVFMTALELLVAYIQAYVFTMLSSLFIGMAQEEPKEA